MKIYDCIIVGAGPAGALCGYVIGKRGFSCLILERLEEYGEKVCGGWLPNIALCQLKQIGIDLNTIDFGIKTYSNITMHGKEKRIYTYPAGLYGLGTTRYDLDRYIAKSAIDVGTVIKFGKMVEKIELRDKVYHVSGYMGKNVVMATGARGFRGDFSELYKEQSFGISAQICGTSILDNHCVYFWYESDECKDYFWAIPIGINQWNIGFWCRFPNRDMLKKYNEGIKKYIDNYFQNYHYISKPKGAFLGNVNLGRAMKTECFGVGDFSGKNSSDTGEGLRFAFKSAVETANCIIEKLLLEKD